jgi:hypothetical protein
MDVTVILCGAGPKILQQRFVKVYMMCTLVNIMRFYLHDGARCMVWRCQVIGTLKDIGLLHFIDMP